jgi:hypothetical protein
VRRERGLDATEDSDLGSADAHVDAAGCAGVDARTAAAADVRTAAAAVDARTAAVAAAVAAVAADTTVECAAAAIEAAATELEGAVTARDFTRIGAANARLHAALRTLERALAAGPAEAGSQAALRARLSPLLARHERLTGTLVELRNATRDELAKTREAHGVAARYLESSE